MPILNIKKDIYLRKWGNNNKGLIKLLNSLI
jgi:hypothetical protein